MSKTNAALAAAIKDLAAAKEDLESVLDSEEIEFFHTDGAEDFDGAEQSVAACEVMALKALDGAVRDEEDADIRAHLLCIRRVIPVVSAKALRGLAKQYG